MKLPEALRSPVPYAIALAVAILAVIVVDQVGGASELRKMTVRSKLHIEAWTEYSSNVRELKGRDGRTLRDSSGNPVLEHFTESTRHPDRWILYTTEGDEVEVARAQFAITNEGQMVIFQRRVGRLSGHSYGWHYVTDTTNPE